MSKDPNSPTTNKDLSEAVDAIMNGMDKIITSVNNLSTEMKNGFKHISENFATKEDLKRENGWVRDDIKGLTGELSGTVSKKEFN